MTYFIILFYFNCIPVVPWVAVVPTKFLLISIGIVTLAPVSLPSTVRVVNNFVLLPNNEVLFKAVILIEFPDTVWLNADLALVITCVSPPKLDNNLLSATVNKYPLGSACEATSLKLSVAGVIVSLPPKFRIILEVFIDNTGN